MYQLVNEYQFIEAFRRMGRLQTSTTSGNFTVDGCRALFEYLEDLADEIGADAAGFQLDPIGLCCDYAEYSSAVDAAEEYWSADEQADHYSRAEDLAERNEIALDWLRDQTTVIEVDGGGVIIQSF